MPELIKMKKEVTEKVTEDCLDRIRTHQLTSTNDLQLTPTDERECIKNLKEEYSIRNCRLTLNEDKHGEKRLEIEEVSEDYSDYVENPPFNAEDKHIKNSNVDATKNDVNSSINDIIVNELEASCNDLGIPIVSVEESSSYPIVIFASKHDNSDTEPCDIKEILRQKLSNGKKTILGLEFPSDKGFEDLINDRTKNSTNPIFNELFAVTLTGDTLRELVKVFNEIQQEYSREKFEIKLIDLTRKEISKFEMDMLVDFMKKPAETLGPDYERNVLIVKDVIHRILGYERSVILVKNVLDLLLKTYEDNNNLVIWTGAFHAEDLLTKLKEIMESGNKDRIAKDKIAVVLSREG